ncbi:hypothetical protein DM02DRAFT_549984 [Periconia macrospinosa]|uniref:MutL C-terminal dimerisation domain-containing protein n=1 Tax=Periconia macrospinosa TaxID=97972 RepID=A0A2V1EEI7_9PLEO|nr:hypothetical protein DM02DRAFT_549984 [Periconia macrospinosa]
MNQHHAGEAESVSTREHPIQPLPPDVAAQVKSSASVVSLTGVVLELLKNSLDANATQIQATVDFVRGACSIEDNGIGIAPSEFREGGGLCRLYCTSKYYSDQACHGCNGTFLASLAAMCLIHIVSRHHQHRSHNLLTAHYSKVIDRQLPAQPHHEIHASHGTRVTVRNLFGNLPVRVKQRATLTEQKSDHGRLWATMKREVTGLLLGWRQPIALKIRDGAGNTMINFSVSGGPPNSANLGSSELQFMLNVLTKANYITVNDWPSWIPTSASTPTISIKGAISLDPAPHKHVQFISLGLRNLSVEDGHNELMDEINRMFSLSSFGVIEDNGIDTDEKIRRERDKRFKHDGYTNKQLTTRKGVDRYPMFHLRIILNNKNSVQAGDNPFKNQRNLQAVLGVMNAMIKQWLSVHNFRPRKSRSDQISGHPSPIRPASAKGYGSDSCLVSEKNLEKSPPNTSHGFFNDKEKPLIRKRKRNTPGTEEIPGARQLQPFAQWSRIKSGKVDFYETYKDVPNRPAVFTQPSTPAARNSSSDVRDIDTTSAPLESMIGDQQSKILADATQQLIPDGEDHDKITTLTDPSTKQTFLLNARTGVVLTRPPARPLSTIHASTLNEYNGQLRLTNRPCTENNAANLWLDGILNAWDNPVFKPTERGIEQVYSPDHSSNTYQKGAHTIANASPHTNSKLSKDGLKRAKVLAQLDSKFILVSMQNLPNGCTDNIPHDRNENNMLVLIDQHAADERIQVENLLADLCKPPSPDLTYWGYHSQLGHRSRVGFVMLEKPIRFSLSEQERHQFITHAARFAAWGILFNIDTSSSTMASGRQQSVLSVSTLPPAISERSRADPQILISFLRSAVWKYTDAEHLIQSNLEDSKASDDVDISMSKSWIRQLSRCPEGLVELINSRACRSAIMFNDQLSMQACEQLVGRLADCAFPFICAHGRPSMVPLVDMGTMSVESSVRNGPTERGSDKGFVAAWKKWKKK